MGDDLMDCPVAGLPPIRCPTRSVGHTCEAAAWITQTFPSVDISKFKVGYGVVEDIKQFVRHNHWATLSVLEILLAQGLPGVGKAEYFLSHWQGEPIEATLL